MRALLAFLAVTLLAVLAFFALRGSSAGPRNPPAPRAAPGAAPNATPSSSSASVADAAAQASPREAAAEPPATPTSAAPSDAARAPALRVVVVAPAGSRVPRAEVCIAAEGPSGAIEGATSLTDEAGVLELAELPRRAHSIEARAAGFAPSERTALAPRPAAGAEITLALRRSARLTGVVHGRDGRLEAARELVVTGPPWCFSRWRATSDERGRFELADLPPGRYEVSRAAAPGEREGASAAERARIDTFLRELRCATLDEGASAHVVLDGRAESSVRLHGVIAGVASPGEPLYVNAASLAVSPATQRRGRLFSTVAQDGGWEIALPAPGPYAVTLDAPSGRLCAREVDVPEQPEHALDLAIPTAIVRGLVRDVRGEPLAGAELALASASDTRRRTTTDENGAFRFERVAAGRFGLHAVDRRTDERGGRGAIAIARAADFELEDGEERVLELRFEAPAELEVVVLGPDGAAGARGAVHRALVRLWDDRSRASPLDASASLDGSGRARFRGLAAGPRWIDARSDTLAAAPIGPIAIEPGARTRVEITLAPAAFVEVTLDEEARTLVNVVSVRDALGRLHASTAVGGGAIRVGPIAVGAVGAVDAVGAAADYTLVALAGTAIYRELPLRATAGTVAVTIAGPR